LVYGKDPVSIHTLAQAAHEIIHTLFKRKGLEDLLFDSDFIKDEYRKEWGQRLKADANFFKHADKDPDSEREFDPRVNQYLLLFSIAGIGRMKERLEDIETTFLDWLGIQNPNLLREDIYAKAIPSDELEKLRRMKPWDFFNDPQARSRLHRPIKGLMP
jgi:hypothetical protein